MTYREDRSSCKFYSNLINDQKYQIHFGHKNIMENIKTYFENIDQVSINQSGWINSTYEVDYEGKNIFYKNKYTFSSASNFEQY